MLTFLFSYHKITLFENKYDIKLITLISMYHLKPLVCLQVQLKFNADVQIASCIDTFQILFTTTFHGQILWTVCVLKTHQLILIKSSCFPIGGKQISIY